jgi:hydroxymethylpyrimidine/phosphomethylpyrimidine kinase
MAYLSQALTIASSDSGGGAGIQADIKAFQANGAFALSVIVALTAQNTKTVSAIHPLPVDFIKAQIDAVFDDFEITGVKTGMLYSSEIVKAVSGRLRRLKVPNLVVDPVMISKGGVELLNPDAVDRMKSDLFPLAALLTPNIHEAERLAGMTIKTMEDARVAAEKIRNLGCPNVLIKGGHLEDRPATDYLDEGGMGTLIPGDHIETTSTHGTGCTYSAAIAAHMARGKPLKEAVLSAKRYITEAIRHGLSIGHGNGPTHHFYFIPVDSEERHG